MDTSIRLGQEAYTTSRDQNSDDYIFEVLTPDQIAQKMVDTINEVFAVIQIPKSKVHLLLHHLKWDKEKLMEQYFSDEQETMFAEGRVLPLQNEAQSLSADSGKKSQLRATAPAPVIQSTCNCEICFTRGPKHAMTALDCGHLFCSSCWTQYLTTKIMNEGMSLFIACPESNCTILVEDQTVLKLVQDPKITKKYQQLLTNSFVECNRLMKWCPGPDCNNAIKVNNIEAKPVECLCGHKFCFACGEAWHDPVRCSFLEKWIKKCDDDSETMNWISANTKDCPKCGATIEKDGGCNHMVCKNQSCKMDFCWVCLGPWEPHGTAWYSCNRYDEDEARSARNAQDKSRAALQRYLFYFNRYANHLQSLKFENKLYQTVMDKMEEMQEQNMSWIDVQFLNEAVDVLCKCRKILMYTYVFAYYLKKSNQTEIFESNQKDLETSTEVLSEYLERGISAENFVDLKQKVQDKYRYCDSRQKVLVSHVHEGYEKNFWIYNDQI